MRDTPHPATPTHDAPGTLDAAHSLLTSPTRGFSMDGGRRLVLVLFLLVTLLLIGAALWPTCWLLQRYAAWAATPGRQVLLVLGAVLVFNYAYLVALLLLRLVIPLPREGLFPRRPNGAAPREAAVFMLNILLTKVRLQTPWAGMFSSVLVNLFPLSLVYPRFFGPHTASPSMGDAALLYDPYYVEAGVNVAIGGGSTITCHIFDHRGLLIKRVKIGDYAVVGACSFVMPGVEIGHHAIVGAKSLDRRAHV